MLRTTVALFTATAALALAGCASKPAASGAASAPAAAPAAPAAPVGSAANPRVVKSRDGRFTGEVIGTPAPGSKFAALQIGMDPQEVQTVLGRAPDRMHTYESGKRWIPFYFGNDARRMQVVYRGEGCLIFTAGNVWGAAGGDLIQIEVDPSGACYKP